MNAKATAFKPIQQIINKEVNHLFPNSYIDEWFYWNKVQNQLLQSFKLDI